MTTPPSSIAGRYELRERIGGDAASELWRAADQQTGRTVAVRLLHERFSGNAAFLSNFRREAQSAAALQHPNLVKTLDYGSAGGRLFLVEELVEGEDLDAWLARGPLPLPQALAVLAQAAAGLAAAHSTGIVHGNVRPNSVRIRGDGVVKVGDLALARAVALSGIAESRRTVTAAAYLSPEQARGGATGPASDVYALGALLFQMLTGELPFAGPSPLDVALQQANAGARPLRSVSAGLPWDVEALVSRALARQPEARFSDASALWSAVVRLPEYGPGTPVIPAAPPAPLDAAAPDPAAPAPERGPQADSPQPAGAPPAAVTPAAAPDPVRPAAAAAITASQPAAVPKNGAAAPRPAAAAAASRAAASASAESAAPEVRPPSGANAPPAPAPAGMGGVTAAALVPDSAQPSSGSSWGIIATMMAFVVIGLLLGVGAVVGYRGLSTPNQASAPRPTATPPAVIVPSVLGRSLEDAQRMAQQQGLEVRVEQRPDSGAEPNTVIDQDPPAGRSVMNGSTVRLMVSAPPPPVTAPNLRGMTEDDARGTLTRAGLTLGDTSEQPSSALDRGRVVGQNPPPGAAVPPNSAVALILGDGGPAAPAVSPSPTPTPERAPAGATPTAPATTRTPQPTEPAATRTPAPTRTATPRTASPTATPSRTATAGAGGATATPRAATPTPGGATATPGGATATPGGATPTAQATPTSGAATRTPTAATLTPQAAATPAPASTAAGAGSAGEVATPTPAAAPSSIPASEPVTSPTPPARRAPPSR